jgi:hypothetical protein
LFSALASKDLGNLRAEMVPAPYDEFIQTLGEQKLERVRRAFEQAYRLGQGPWLAMRRRAHGLAAEDYDRLRLKVTTFGKDAFATLPVSARLELMDDQTRYAEFVFEKGVSMLSPSDRARIGKASEFRSSQDRDRFLEREGFAGLSPEDRALAVTPAALSEEETEEKLLLHDKLGIPLLSPDLREEIGSITRAALRDSTGFKLLYGEQLARQFLRSHQIPSESGLESCVYPWAAERGSLLNGTQAVCRLSVALAVGRRDVSVFLVKQKYEWRVVAVRPQLTEVGW